MTPRLAGAVVAALLAVPAARAADAPNTVPTRSGRDIYTAFHAGLADPDCDDAGSVRWRDHFAAAPQRLAAPNDDALALFGYVVDALRAASLPTEYALIPFVESGYRPNARSPGGPAGLWQMIAVTARNHHVPMRAGYDGRLSPVDSTAAAVRYLKTLHGMFAGDWRLAVMAYNAGEYRVLGSLRHSGQVARSADPEKLVGLSGITRAYVRKLHALSCLLDRADDRDEWLQALDRPVPVLEAAQLPSGTASLEAWARRNSRDRAVVRRLNPAFPDGRVPYPGLRVLAPVVAAAAPPAEVPATDSLQPPAPASSAPADAVAAIVAPPPRTHVVSRGESAWTIARRYGLRVGELLARNGLATRAVLRPGMVLKLDGGAGE